MAVQSAKGQYTIAVGASPATAIAAATVQITDPSNASTFIADGQVIMLDHLDRPITAATANIGDSPYFRFVTRVGSTAASASLNFSSRMRGVDITKVIGTNYVAAQEQITYLGFNGASGSIDTTASADYTVTLVGDWDYAMWEQQKYRKVYNYFNVAATQKLIAQNISSGVNFDTFKAIAAGTGGQVAVECFNDGTTQGSANAANVAVVNGSDIITFSAAQTTTILAVGTVIRLGAPAATTTSPVYIIVGNSSTDSSLASATGSAPQARIHTYYQGATATISTRGTNWDMIITETNWGMRFSGLAQTTGIPPYTDFKYQKVAFHLDTRGLGSTTVTNSQTAKRGTGVGNLVQEQEYFAMGNEGALNRTVIPLPLGRSAALAAGTYNEIFVETKDRQGQSQTITAAAPQNIATYIAIPTGNNAATKNMGVLLTQLNPYIASAGGFPALVFTA